MYLLPSSSPLLLQRGMSARKCSRKGHPAPGVVLPTSFPANSGECGSPEGTLAIHLVILSLEAGWQVGPIATGAVDTLADAWLFKDRSEKLRRRSSWVDILANKAFLPVQTTIHRDSRSKRGNTSTVQRKGVQHFERPTLICTAGPLMIRREI